MTDPRPLLVALLLTVPAACHDDRDAEHPGPLGPRGNAGMDVGPPSPATTNEPVVPGIPNAINMPDHFGPGPIAQATGGAGGTLGTGGTGAGGFGALGGTGGIGTGGGIGAP